MKTEIVCDRCPRYTKKPSPKDTGCPGVETCKKIAANNGEIITLVEIEARRWEGI